MQELVENRIVELAFTPWSELPAALRRIGLKVEVEEEGHTLVIQGESMRVGLIDTDYTTKAVQIAFAYCGARWASFLPNLLSKVDKEWKQRSRTKKLK